MNVLAALGLSVLVILLFLQLLGWITQHGQYRTVPVVTGMDTRKAVAFLEGKGFEVVIRDSVYTDTAARGIVLKQLPEPGSTVKVNRAILLTVNRSTLPLVDMPALEGKSLLFALDILRRSHLRLGDTLFRPDFMRGSVLEQQYRGRKIAPGEKVTWGSPIDLVIGSGLSQENLPVPELFGKTLEEARIILQESGVLLGAIVVDPDVTDSASAFIWKQMPPRYDEYNNQVYIQPGQLMDLWISREPRARPDSFINP